MMHPAIQINYEGKRGCGYRTKLGSLYLISGDLALPCGKLPIPLEVCPTCGAGFKPARGWTWVDAHSLARETVAKKECYASFCECCPVISMLRGEIQRTGLLWIGEKFYKKPLDFVREAGQMGVCRRIPHVPKEFKLGETWILLAHRKAIMGPILENIKAEFKPGIFQVFKPTTIEVLCDGTEQDEKIEGYLKRGLTPVLVKKKQNELFEQGGIIN